MRNPLVLMLLAGFCFLAFSQEAKAGVTSITDVTYYEPTNEILAWAEVVPDYDTMAYYFFDDWGDVRKNEEVIDTFWGTSNDMNDTYYEGFFSYDADAEYTIQVYPQMHPKFNHPIDTGYDDYYNYVSWESGESVFFPYSFDFSGNGPEVSINTNSIILGGVYSLFTEGGTAGPPDHVRVISDTGQDQHYFCVAVARVLQLKVEDYWNRRVTRGTLPLSERYYDSSPTSNELTSVYSTCTNSYFFPTQCHQRDAFGRFHDAISAGCNANTVQPCGAADFDVSFKWCPRGQHEKDLSRTTRRLSFDEVLINGVAKYNSNDRLP